MTELNLEQSKKADYLLDIICNSNSALGTEIANGIFESERERNFVFSILKKFNLITVIQETENDPFYLFGWNENTCHFLKSEGGFTKRFEKTNTEDLEIVFSKTDKNKEFVMDDNTIQTLESLKNGKSFTLTKDSPNEISELIINLKNLGILHKPTKFGYACELRNRKYLTKLIELKSWDKFLDWSENENSQSHFINDFSGSTIGQVTQSSKKIDLNNPIKQVVHNRAKESKKKSWFEILAWAIGIIAGLVAIYEFILKEYLN